MPWKDSIKRSFKAKTFLLSCAWKHISLLIITVNLYNKKPVLEVAKGDH